MTREIMLEATGAVYSCSRQSCQQVLQLTAGVAGLGYVSATTVADNLAAEAGWSAWRTTRQTYHYCPDCQPGQESNKRLLWGWP